MRYAYFGFGMLLFGSIGLVLIVMMQSITINNDSEYYNLKEAMQAAMVESVDYVCYRVDGQTVSLNENNDCGYLLKISEQKFVENFTRRFIATVGGDATKYTLDFYDIIESPPKASVIIRGNTNNYGIVSQGEEITINNSLSGVLELKNGIVEKYGYFEGVKVDDSDTVTSSDFVPVNSNTSEVKVDDVSASSEKCDSNGCVDTAVFCKSHPNDDACKDEGVGEEVDDDESFDKLDAEDKSDGS